MSENARAQAKTVKKSHAAPHPDHPNKVATPAKLTRESWRFALKNARRQFGGDNVTDLAAAMTYYTVLAVFPLLLAVVSLVSLFGRADSLLPVIENLIRSMASAQAADFIGELVAQFLAAQGGSLTLVIGILAALWSASAYIGAFSRAMNTIYQVREGRSAIAIRAMQLLVTGILVVSIVILLAALVISAPVARWVGALIGFGETAVTVWSIARWPLMGVVAALLLALMYYLTPNVKQPRFVWVSVGSVAALVIAVLIALGFSAYLSLFNGANSYTKTYGALAGVIIALFFMWLMNLALLIGAEIDSEIERARQLQSGMPAENELQLPPKDDAGAKKALARMDAAAREAHRIRLDALRGGAEPPGWYQGDPAELDRKWNDMGEFYPDADSRAASSAHPGAALAARMVARKRR